MKVNAMLFYSNKKPCHPEVIELPDTPPDSSDIVEVLGCGFCGTDGHFMDGSVPPLAFGQGVGKLVLGHEIIGRSTTTGKLVIVPAVLGCGKCMNCTSGRSNLCEKGIMLGSNVNGGFAEYILVKYADNLCVLPDDIESKIDFPVSYFSIVADALATPYHAVFNQGKVKPGDRVVVIGCGGLGLNVVQMAKAAGANVVGLDLQQQKIDNLSVINGSGICTQREGKPGDVFKAIRSEVKDALGGVPTHCFEVAGHPDAFNLAYGLVGRGGSLIVVGYTGQPVGNFRFGNIMGKELTIKGVWGCPYEDYPTVVKMVLDKKILVEPLVTGTFCLTQLNDAFKALQDPKTIRSVVVPDRVLHRVVS